MGLDIYLDWPGAPKDPDYPRLTANIDAETNPDHICKRNYLRSSYNGAGFDSVAESLIGMSLYTIFEPLGVSLDGYEYQPTDEQLRDCRSNAEQALERMEKAPALGAMFQRSSPLRDDTPSIVSERTAIEMFREQTENKDDPFGGGGGWSNAVGAFWPTEPPEVVGVMPGTGYGGAGLYLVFRKDLTYYIETCKIIIEFIDEALAHPAREIRWSG